MSYLLDTHALIWALLDPDRLGRRASIICLGKGTAIRSTPSAMNPLVSVIIPVYNDQRGMPRSPAGALRFGL